MLKPSNYRIADDMDYFTAIFRQDKMEFFDVYDEEKNPNGKPVLDFFSDIDRIRMVGYALTQAEFGKKKNGGSAGFGIKRLINQKVFVSAYPVHDGPVKTDPTTDEKPGTSVTVRFYRYTWIS